MNKKTSFNTKLLRTLLSVGLATTSADILAQEDEDEKEKIYELSPFTVDVEQNVGYQAASTLAGTRLRTPLKDVTAAISVVTQEFMDDTASTNPSDLFVYTTGTEVAGMGGNFTNTNSGNGNVTDDNEVSRSTPTVRIRGLATADLSRNYFQTSIPFDSYNTSQVEVNRGANAVLFGLGSPAGIINNTTDDAQFFDRGRVGFQIGRFGSVRGTLNVNKVIIPGEFAIRVAAVSDERDYNQRFAFNNVERYYAAFKHSRDWFNPDDDLFGMTTIRAKFEKGKLRSNNPHTIPPVDMITPWFHPYTDDVLGTVNLPVKPAWNAQTGSQYGKGRFNTWKAGVITDINDTTLDSGRLSFWVFDGFRYSPGLIFNNENSGRPADPLGGNFIGRQGNIRFPSMALENILLTRPTYDPVTGSGPNPGGGWGNLTMMTTTTLATALSQWRGTTANPGRVGYAGRFTNPVMTDPSIFDFYNQSLSGANKREFSDFDVVNLNVDQLFLNNKAGIEFSFSSENYDDGFERLNISSSGRKGLGIDVNRILYDGSDNPNFGRPVFTSNASYRRSATESRVRRLSGFFDLDFRDDDGAIKKWLGRHVLSGLVSSYTTENHVISGPLGAWDPISGIWGNPGRMNNFTNRDEGRKVSSLHYLGPSLRDRQAAAGSNIPQLGVNQFPTSDKIYPGSMFRVNTDSRGNDVIINGKAIPLAKGFNDVGLTVVDNAVGGSSIDKNVFDSQVAILQSYLLNDYIVGTLAWRKDEYDARSLGNGERTPFGDYDVDPNRYHIGLVPDARALIGEEDSLTWGVVAKVPEPWLESVPGISSFQIQYGESSNFQPSSVRRDSRGELISNPNGSTEDYGFVMGLFEDKFELRVIRYESAQNGVTVGAIGADLGVRQYTAMYNKAIQASTDPLIDFPKIDSDGKTLLGDHNEDGVADTRFSRVPQWMLDLHKFTINPSTGFAEYETAPSFQNTSDIVSKGTEFEIVYNPTPNWRILLNGANQEAIQSNVALDVRQLYTEELLFDIDGDGQAETTMRDAFVGPWADFTQAGTIDQTGGGGNVVNYSLLWADFWGLALERAIQFEGQPNPEVREWRWNLVTNYSFTEGKLAGFNLGGAVRWEDSLPIGYKLTTDSGGRPISDLSNPFFGEEVFNLDLWVGYGRRLFDKVDWDIQLNVRNLNNDNLIPIVANPDGRIAIYRISPPVTWSIRNTFSF